VEASAIGNLVVQYIALGQITDLKEARAIIKRSFPLQTYEPQQRDRWEEAYASFRSLIGE
jgi:rhamnulokinase